MQDFDKTFSKILCGATSDPRAPSPLPAYVAF